MSSRAFLEDVYQRQPTWATYLGIHKYDDRLEDYSRKGVDDASPRREHFASRVAAIDEKSLSPERQLDREQLLRAIDSRLLTLEVVRPWAGRSRQLQQRPDAHRLHHDQAQVCAARGAAAAADRAREGDAGGAGRGAGRISRTRRASTPRSPSSRSTAIAGSSRRPWPRRFRGVTDKALLAEFKQANDAVIAALAEYKKWLQDDLLKRSNGDFAIGEETYRRKLAADEMIDLPLDELLAIAERDLRKNQAAFAETARQIDPKRTPPAGAEDRRGRSSAGRRSCCRRRRPSSMRSAAS